MKLTSLQKELDKYTSLKNSYIIGNYCPMDYELIISKIRIIKSDIKRLSDFKKKIIENEVKGYGYD